MLARTANDLHWIGRHVERAENTARLLDVTWRTSLLPYHAQEPGLAWAEPWAVPLVSCGLATAFYKRYRDITAENVLRYMVFDASNSVVDLVLPARGARVGAGGARRDDLGDVRGPELGLARDARRRLRRRCRRAGSASSSNGSSSARTSSAASPWARCCATRPTTSCASAPTSSARTTPRASSTPSTTSCCRPAADVGGAVDYYQWASLLQSVSGFESYRKIYSDVISPKRVAELLVLRADMPRSLHACMNLIDETLKHLCDDRSVELERMSGELHARLHYGRVDDVMREGLHEYLIDFLERISALSSEVTARFLVPAG